MTLFLEKSKWHTFSKRKMAHFQQKKTGTLLAKENWHTLSKRKMAHFQQNKNGTLLANENWHTFNKRKMAHFQKKKIAHSQHLSPLEWGGHCQFGKMFKMSSPENDEGVQYELSLLQTRAGNHLVILSLVCRYMPEGLCLEGSLAEKGKAEGFPLGLGRNINSFRHFWFIFPHHFKGTGTRD